MPAPTMMIFSPGWAESLIPFVRSWSAILASDFRETKMKTMETRADDECLKRNSDQSMQVFVLKIHLLM
jgi:hypothetical protein